MSQETLQETDRAAVTGISFISFYVDDFDRALPFYTDILGLKESQPMGEVARYFDLPDGRGMYLIGGGTPAQIDRMGVRSSIAFEVGSVGALMEKLRSAGAEILNEEPMQMNENTWWIQFRDPAGNLLEAMGDR
jgi:predicted enzyme related to lactoylglutathione lyase